MKEVYTHCWKFENIENSEDKNQWKVFHTLKANIFFVNSELNTYFTAKSS